MREKRLGSVIFLSLAIVFLLSSCVFPTEKTTQETYREAKEICEQQNMQYARHLKNSHGQIEVICLEKDYSGIILEALV